MLCNHFPGTYCSNCYAFTPGSGTAGASSSATFFACGGCGRLSIGTSCGNCGQAFASTDQPLPVSLGGSLAAELAALRDELDDIKADVNYLLSMTAPTGSRRRRRKATAAEPK